MKIVTTIEISPLQIAYLLSSAFEGGIGYWAEIFHYTDPTEPFIYSDVKDFPDYVTYPMIDGSVTIRDTETDKRKKLYVLDNAALVRGMQLMATETPRHFADFMAGNFDAITGDVYVQLCLFGDVIYG